jgi:hypothetical protein
VAPTFYFKRNNGHGASPSSDYLYLPVFQLMIGGRRDMKPFTLSLFAIITLAALIAGISLPRPVQGDNYVPLKIDVDRDRYSLTMSSTVGIGLTPVGPPAGDNRTVMFLWQTDYGHFLSWKAPDFKVKDLGNDVYTDDGKIYWSYLAKDGRKVMRPVHITLTMIDSDSRAVLSKAGLTIGWDDLDTAVVKA